MKKERKKIKYNGIRHFIYEIISPKEENSIILDEIFDFFIITLIILNILAIVLQSFDSLYLKYKTAFYIFELVSVIIFTIEYLLRILTADLKYPKKNYLLSLLIFIISPMALIDLFAILPFYIPMVIALDLRFLRIFRVFRILRVFKFNRYISSLSIIINVLKRKKRELVLVFVIIIILILISSTFMYYVEKEAQPDNFSNILTSLWWTIMILTKTRYGNVYPITTVGKILSSIISFLSIGFIALPTGILSSGFIEEIKTKNENKNNNVIKCSHCGKFINLDDNNVVDDAK